MNREDHAKNKPSKRQLIQHANELNKPRVVAIDVLRGLALFGVLSVNLMQEFRVSIFLQMIVPPEPQAWLDQLAQGIVSQLFSFKAIAVFSMLFGYGLSMQYQSLRARGRAMVLLGRRLFVLLLFGLVHLLCLWNGDILTHYAIVGFIVLPFLLLPRPYLLISAGFALLIFLLPQWQPWTIQWASSAQLGSAVTAANEIYPIGSYAQIMQLRWDELPLIFQLHQFVFPRTLALFLFGAWCHRIDIVNKLQSNRRLTFSFAIGAASIYLLERVMERYGLFLESPTLANILINLAPILLAIAYAALILVLCNATADGNGNGNGNGSGSRNARGENQASQGKLSIAFAAVGKMAFTNYLMQSLVLTWIFYGYGLGQFNKMSEANGFGLACTIYLGQIAFSLLWLRRFQLGPLEWLWRSMMFGRWVRGMSL